MSQRESGYERKERDLYETPAWVTEALIPHLPITKSTVFEPAAGGGKMVDALVKSGFDVVSSDIETGRDFLAEPLPMPICAIITNPPYILAREFIEYAIKLMQPSNGLVAMLLRTNFDHAKTQACLFSECSAFAKKVVLRKRIKWFEDSKGQPSFNHAWFIWDWKNQGLPTLAYGP